MVSPFCPSVPSSLCCPSATLRSASVVACVGFGLDGAVADVVEEEHVSVKSEWSLLASVVSSDTGDSVGGAGVSRSSSLRDTTEDARLETLPVDVRFERERRENAAAEEAVDVREEVGAAEE